MTWPLVLLAIGGGTALFFIAADAVRQYFARRRATSELQRLLEYYRRSAEKGDDNK